MIRAVRLQAHNFRALRHIDLAFPREGAVLIEGMNEAGKSSLFEAFFFGVYGQPLIKTPGPGRTEYSLLVRYQADSAIVAVDLEVDDLALRVARTVYRNRPNDAELTIQAVEGPPEQVRGVAAVNARVVELLGGLDGEALLSSCFVEQKRLDKLEALDRRQREQALAALLNLDRLTQVSKLLRPTPEEAAEEDRLGRVVALAEQQRALPALRSSLALAEDRRGALTVQDLLAEYLSQADQARESAASAAQHEQDAQSARDRLTLVERGRALEARLHEMAKMSRRCGDAQGQVTAVEDKIAALDRLEQEDLPALQARVTRIVGLAERLRAVRDIDGQLGTTQQRLALLEQQTAEDERVHQRLTELDQEIADSLMQSADIERQIAEAERQLREDRPQAVRQQQRLADAGSLLQALETALQDRDALSEQRDHYLQRAAERSRLQAQVERAERDLRDLVDRAEADAAEVAQIDAADTDLPAAEERVARVKEALSAAEQLAILARSTGDESRRADEAAAAASLLAARTVAADAADQARDRFLCLQREMKSEDVAALLEAWARLAERRSVEVSSDETLAAGKARLAEAAHERTSAARSRVVPTVFLGVGVLAIMAGLLLALLGIVSQGMLLAPGVATIITGFVVAATSGVLRAKGGRRVRAADLRLTEIRSDVQAQTARIEATAALGAASAEFERATADIQTAGEAVPADPEAARRRATEIQASSRERSVRNTGEPLRAAVATAERAYDETRDRLRELDAEIRIRGIDTSRAPAVYQQIADESRHTAETLQQQAAALQERLAELALPAEISALASAHEQALAHQAEAQAAQRDLNRARDRAATSHRLVAERSSEIAALRQTLAEDATTGPAALEQIEEQISTLDQQIATLQGAADANCRDLGLPATATALAGALVRVDGTLAALLEREADLPRLKGALDTVRQQVWSKEEQAGLLRARIDQAGSTVRDELTHARRQADELRQRSQDGWDALTPLLEADGLEPDTLDRQRGATEQAISDLEWDLAQRSGLERQRAEHQAALQRLVQDAGIPGEALAEQAREFALTLPAGWDESAWEQAATRLRECVEQIQPEAAAESHAQLRDLASAARERERSAVAALTALTSRIGLTFLASGRPAPEPLTVPHALAAWPALAEIGPDDRSAIEAERDRAAAALQTAEQAVAALAQTIGLDPATPVLMSQAACALSEAREAVAAKQLASEMVRTAQRRLLERVLPATERNLCVFLPLLTAGRYLDARLTEDFTIEVWDSDARAYVTKQLFSGGARDQFSLALRLAFAMATVPEHLGATPGFLFLDEPLSSFDEERTQALVELVTAGILRQHFPQIFVISHAKSFDADRFPYRIRLADGAIVESTLA